MKCGSSPLLFLFANDGIFVAAFSFAVGNTDSQFHVDAQNDKRNKFVSTFVALK